METVLIIGLAFAFGGILKGATGVGAPILAVPMMVVFFDMPFAIAVFSLPNLLPNLWQAWAFRRYHLPASFVVRFAAAGGIGAAVGTFLLANTPTDLLSLVLALVVLTYVAFRLAKPTWQLPYAQALRLALPVGFIAGILQGGAGLSAPASLTYLTAMRLERGVFISTISIFFVGLGVVQIPMLVGYGLLNRDTVLISAAALIPLIIFMPIGARLARHIPRHRFDQVLLVILTLLSLKLLAGYLI